MKRSISIIVSVMMLISSLQAQNLVVNPDAESLPRGTGWTVISQGALACLLVPTNNMINWTMKPNGSVNYPFDHTLGVDGGTVFFSGCDTYLTGPFQLEQVIDVSADSIAIDAGTQLYDFSGYMQTPVPIQTDMGRFVVDFMNNGSTILGTSYKSIWQSNFDGSGPDWIQYTNTRTAPAGTRKVKITLEARLYVNQPAINVYFDDVTFSKTIVVPLGLLSFTGRENNGRIYLNWKMSPGSNCKDFIVERSIDATNFEKIATINSTALSNYQFTDDNIDPVPGKYYYRLKMISINEKTAYSNIAMIKTAGIPSFSLSPNPAQHSITIAGLTQAGNVSIISYSGVTMLSAVAKSSSLSLDIAGLPAGLYIVKYDSEKGSIQKKLMVAPR